MLESFVREWGYLAVLIGTGLEGEAVLLVGAAMAHRGLLALPGVALAGFLGSVLSDQLWFWLGRRAGPRFVARRPRLARGVARVQRFTARFGNAFVLGFRFLYGMRTLSPIVLGMTGFAPGRFALLNALGALLWVGVFCAVGYGLGAVLHGLLGRATHVEEAAALALGVALMLWLGTRRAHRASTGARANPPAS
jgi:membrane protein DedA with SNARE-associated domain